ncbi:MAG: site-2 protease family protein [bacterium]
MMNSSFLEIFAQMAMIIPAFLLALSFHEFAHALTATILGDDTAKKSGRLTLNPFAHVDPMGLLFLLIFRVGWAKPVPFNYNNFKRPKLYSILTGLAGPVANFILAIVCFILIRFFPEHFFPMALTKSFIQILEATAYINVMLGVFNLLPIPPLDGSHVITALFSARYPQFVFWLYQYSMIILIFLLFFPVTYRWLALLINYVYFFLRALVF